MKKDDPMQNDVQKAHVFVDNCSSKSCFKRSPCTRRSCRTWWANNKQSTDVKRALSILLVYLSGRPPRIQMFTFDRRQFLRLKMQERLNVVQSLLRRGYDWSCTEHGTFFEVSRNLATSLLTQLWCISSTQTVKMTITELVLSGAILSQKESWTSG